MGAATDGEKKARRVALLDGGGELRDESVLDEEKHDFGWQISEQEAEHQDERGERFLGYPIVVGELVLRHSMAMRKSALSI